jgi:hypothetical protein
VSFAIDPCKMRSGRSDFGGTKKSALFVAFGARSDRGLYYLWQQSSGDACSSIKNSFWAVYFTRRPSGKHDSVRCAVSIRTDVRNNCDNF